MSQSLMTANVDFVLSSTPHRSNRLIEARMSLLNEIYTELDNSERCISKIVRIRASTRNNLNRRVDAETDEIAPGPDYRPAIQLTKHHVPEWYKPTTTPEARQMQRLRPRNPSNSHSEPQTILYHRLKQWYGDLMLCRLQAQHEIEE